LLKEAMGEYKQAVAVFKLDQADEAVSRATVYAALAQVLIDLGHLKEASLAYEQVVALQQDSPSTDVYHTQLAELYVKQKSFAAAEENCQRLCENAEKPAV